jgi:SAM-dependent methyltransferase
MSVAECLGCGSSPAPPRDISLSLSARDRMLREGLYRALLRAVCDVAERISVVGRPLQVLDVGCGRGELLRLLAKKGFAATGIDMESACVAMASAHAECRQAAADELPRLFRRGTFDVIVCSHVLEHAGRPIDTLQVLRGLAAGGYVIAVPNLLRPARVFRAALGRGRGDHPTHLYGWGRAELDTALRAAGFAPTRWYGDRVTISPFGGPAGGLLSRLLSPLEVGLLPRVFPLMASSLIAACVAAEPVEAVRCNRS